METLLPVLLLGISVSIIKSCALRLSVNELDSPNLRIIDAVNKLKREIIVASLVGEIQQIGDELGVSNL